MPLRNIRGVQALRCIAHQNKSFSTNNTEQTLKKDHLLRSDFCEVLCMRGRCGKFCCERQVYSTNWSPLEQRIGEYVNIACQLYDYIEIACMYGLEVSVVLKDGNTVKGTTLTTVIDKRNDVATECIQMSIDKTTQNIALNEIAQLHAITDNPHFSSVSF